MNRSGPEIFARLAQQLNRARMQAATGGGGGNGGGGAGGIPGGGKGIAAGGGLLIALAAGGLALNYSLYNGLSKALLPVHYPSTIEIPNPDLHE